MTYQDQLKDPRWQKKRLQIMERDGFQCALCMDSKSTLHVHHKKYIKGKEPWSYDDNYLITLCDKCHWRKHDPLCQAYEQDEEFQERYKDLRYDCQEAGSFSHWLQYQGNLKPAYQNEVYKNHVKNWK